MESEMKFAMRQKGENEVQLKRDAIWNTHSNLSFGGDFLRFVFFLFMNKF